MTRGTLIVRRHRPWRDLLLASLALAAAATGGWVIYDLGRGTERAAHDATRSELERMVEVGVGLARENERLRDRVAELERTAQVRGEAYARVEASLRGLEEDIVGLREELAFYRGIVESTRSGKGLKVQSFRVQQGRGERDFRYRLVLTRVSKDDKVTDGTVTLLVSGERMGKPATVGLSELTEEGASDIPFQFRHFHKIEGQMTLPAGFVPQSIEVRVTASGKPQTRLEKTYDWPRRVG